MTIEQFRSRGRGFLPGLLGIEFLEVGPGRAVARLALSSEHLAPNGFLHAASVVALADTACGYGCIAALPPGADNFATLELKTNFLGTARQGAIRVLAELVHGGRTTQVWDATVTDEANGKVLAVFRCTQLLLYEKDEARP
jgi:uncharacterized protein (TIGR00369 family)